MEGKQGFVNLITIRAKPGKVEEIFRIFNGVRNEILANEPFTKAYIPGISEEDPLEIWLWEHYESEEALAKHRTSKPYLVWAEAKERLVDSIVFKRLKPM